MLDIIPKPDFSFSYRGKPADMNHTQLTLAHEYFKAAISEAT